MKVHEFFAVRSAVLRDGEFRPLLVQASYDPEGRLDGFRHYGALEHSYASWVTRYLESPVRAAASSLGLALPHGTFTVTINTDSPAVSPLDWREISPLQLPTLLAVLASCGRIPRPPERVCALGEVEPGGRAWSSLDRDQLAFFASVSAARGLWPVCAAGPAGALERLLGRGAAVVPRAREPVLEAYPMSALLREAAEASESLGAAPSDRDLGRYDALMRELERRLAPPREELRALLLEALDDYREHHGWQGLPADAAIETFCEFVGSESCSATIAGRAGDAPGRAESRPRGARP